MGRYSDDESFFTPPVDRREVTARMFAKAGIGIKSEPETQRAREGSGSLILRSNAYLTGSTLTGVGSSNGREDAGGQHDMSLWRCTEHPRMDVMMRLYWNRVEYTYLVDGEPFADLDKAAALLAEREAVTGIYDRPRFEAGDDARGPVGADD